MKLHTVKPTILGIVVAVIALVLSALAYVAMNRIVDYKYSHVNQPYPTKVTKVAHIEEDDPGWNCITMGDNRCGPLWKPAPLSIDGHADCLWRIGATTWVACPDGYVTTS